MTKNLAIAWAMSKISNVICLPSKHLGVTNINHKGLQKTANEYAEERRIYKDLISKNNNADIKFCKQNTAMLIVLREN